MRLLDSTGKFNLFHDEQVKIDTNLPKYKFIQQLQKEKEKELGKEENKVKMSYMGQEDDVDGLDIELDSPNLPGSGRQSAEVVEKILSDIISETEADGTLLKYMKDPDAKDFNERFFCFFVTEFNANKWSVSGTWNSSDKDSPRTGWFQSILRAIDTSLKDLPIFRTGDVLKLFANIHVETGKEHDFANRIDGFLKLIEKAEKCGQAGLKDRLLHKMVAHVYESILFYNGINRYITVEELVNLQSKCTRVVDIDYIENFGRIIPDNVVDKKCLVDKLMVFDNYCVLYYDPTEKTEQKKEIARRDPILFGLINHSNKLYYIADWIDDLCDLTLDEVAAKLGNSSIKEIKEEIDTGTVLA